MTIELETVRKDEAFLTSPDALCVLDEDLVVRAVNPAYLTLSGMVEDELLSFGLFDVFPANPEEPESDGHVELRASAERVLREGRLHHMLVQRYDIPDRAREGGRFLTRYWLPMNRPLLHGSGVRGVINRVRPVEPPTPEALSAIQAVREATGGGLFLDEPADEARIEAFGRAVERIANLGREVSQLREALTSRATIEQAKGLVMADRGCTPDEAFKVLVKLSNDTNVRVAEVARALVYKAQNLMV
ncbi:ANTAR domain-containing protein [Nocardioides solisilvae]|uniref:ANTAR domain-containing protein n=1 Tax=Nocardioides solisilvae TaxID=1542435 RepID=UPI000D746D24|nr:ANTAR domain-containing protein [Nocardioides solisilvae]